MLRTMFSFKPADLHVSHVCPYRWQVCAAMKHNCYISIVVLVRDRSFIQPWGGGSGRGGDLEGVQFPRRLDFGGGGQF